MRSQLGDDAFAADAHAHIAVDLEAWANARPILDRGVEAELGSTRALSEAEVAMCNMLELHPTGARILPKSAFYSSCVASNDGVVAAVGAAEAVTRSMAHASESSLLEVSGIPGPLCPSPVRQATVDKVNHSISNQRNQVSAALPANGGCGARVLPALPVAPVEPLVRAPRGGFKPRVGGCQ